MHKLLLAFALAASCATAQAARPGCERWVAPAGVSASAIEATSSHAYHLLLQMDAAFKSSNPASARPLAVEFLSSVSTIPCDWNYGNAIHNANSVLGLLALHEGKKAEALTFLKASSMSPGSPQLNSYGPSLMLAHELANAGEYDAVAQYVQNIGKFWNPDDTRAIALLLPFFKDPDLISTWLKKLQRHDVPDFGMNAKKSP